MTRRPPRNGEIREEIQNTLLIDGSSIYKIGFHGSHNEYNSRGEHIGGLYQFLTVFRKLLTENLYHKAYVFWDGPFSGKLRYNFYKDYKSKRNKDYINGTQPTDESELKQKKLVWEYLNELSIRQIQHEVVEADDFIAYYCLNKKQNEKITIATSDKDMLQLINDDVKIYFGNLKVYVDNTNFSKYFCYHHTNSCLMKTITGDNSDSIKGIKGVGEDTLINLFPELSNTTLTLNDIISKASILQEERLKSKKKPLKSLSNLINKVTDGIQGELIYEINDTLVNLKNPLLTEDAIDELETLKNGYFEPNENGYQNIMKFMKRDEMDKAIGETRYPDYLIPFKKLNQREIKQKIN